jgi:hypothetical protein
MMAVFLPMPMAEAQLDGVGFHESAVRDTFATTADPPR